MAGLRMEKYYNEFVDQVVLHLNQLKKAGFQVFEIDSDLKCINIKWRRNGTNLRLNSKMELCVSFGKGSQSQSHTYLNTDLKLDDFAKFLIILGKVSNTDELIQAEKFDEIGTLKKITQYAVLGSSLMVQLIYFHIIPHDQSARLINKFHIGIRRNDVQTVLSSSTMNRNAMIFYLNLLCERNNKTAFLPHFECIEIDDVNKYLTSTHESMEDVKNLLHEATKIIIIPIHDEVNQSWQLATINIPDGIIKFFDSTGKTNGIAIELLLRFADTANRGVEWKCEVVTDIPLGNDINTGIFVCMYAHFLTRGRTINFNPEYWLDFRFIIMCAISSSHLVY